MRSKADIGPEVTRRPVPDGAGAARHRPEVAHVDSTAVGSRKLGVDRPDTGLLRFLKLIRALTVGLKCWVPTRNSAMVAESACITCSVKRIVIGVTPVARGYEMRSLECPQCRNLFRLVVRHRRPYSKTLGN